jgi:hypothetical protein
MIVILGPKIELSGFKKSPFVDRALRKYFKKLKGILFSIIPSR